MNHIVCLRLRVHIWPIRFAYVGRITGSEWFGHLILFYVEHITNKINNKTIHTYVPYYFLCALSNV